MTAATFLPRASAGPRPAPVFLVVLALAVFVSAWCCIALIAHTGRVSTIWVSNAFVVACLLKTPRRMWRDILGTAFLALLAADIVAGDAPVRAVGLASANIVEMLTIAWPLRRLGFDRNFSNSEVLLTFYGLLVAACTASSAIAAVTLNLTLGLPLLASMLTWFGADALGLSLLLPFLMCVKPSSIAEMFSPGKRLHSIVLLAAVAAVGSICVTFPSWTLSFLYVPVLILLTFRRGFAGGAIGLVIALAFSFGMVIFDHPSPSLVTHSLPARVAMIQLYYSVIGFTIILCGAALEERRKLEQSLAIAAKRAEASREEALVAKEVAERASQTKSSFLANMSHELRTPLNAVLGFSEIISGEMFGPVGDGRYREYAGLINSAGTHLLDLISDILDMSKIEAGKLELNRERLDPSALVAECLQLMAERAAAGGVALEVDLEAAPRRVSADRRAFKQILLNLLSNAIKFTPRGGQVSVTLADEGALCRLGVTDTGVGIPASEIERLGNPFIQLARHSGQAGGTGLGLALVRGLAELHGGRFRIASVEGQGTTVSVFLPISPPVVVSQAG